MEGIDLTAAVRHAHGKGPSKRLRREGVVPAVVYRHGQPTLAIQVAKRDFLKAMGASAGANAVFQLRIASDGSEETRTVLVKEVQHDPISGEVIHVDFGQILLTERVKVTIPLVPTGAAPGVREGGVLQHIVWKVEVECLARQIPEKIEVDVSKLEIGDRLHLRDAVVPSGVKVLGDPEQIIFLVAALEVEKPAEAAAEAVTEPEVIRQKKDVEEETEEAPAPEKAEKGKEEKPEKSKEK